MSVETEICDCNIVVPASGRGQRFIDAGFTVPKPYLDLFGKLIFQWAFDSLTFTGKNNIFIVREEHLTYLDIKTYIANYIKDSTVITEKSPTGQLSSVLQAKSIINNNTPLIVCNSDHRILLDRGDLLFRIDKYKPDALIISFYDDQTDPIYSYVKMNNEGAVIETAEKNKISNFAMAGIYYFSKGSTFVKYAEKMIADNKTINEEYYVSPIFNDMIKDNLNVVNMLCMKITTLGTPNDYKQILWNGWGRNV
jgi:NDP-sugar pyrophosphorylase family protein